MKNVIVGGGAFGTAFAAVLARTGIEVGMLMRDATLAESINTRQVNPKYLPDAKIPRGVFASVEAASVLHHAEHVFLAVPSKGLVDKVTEILPHLPADACLINLSKGMHPELITLDRAIKQAAPQHTIGAIKGPNFARPLLHGAPSGMTLAVEDVRRQQPILDLFRETNVQMETWPRVADVEFAGAMKNVLAVAMGICDAIEDNANTRFLIIQKMINEARALLQVFGHDAGVLFTYAGLGDMLMTALNDTSRNRTLGLLIGRGFDFTQVGGPVLEGRKSTRLLREHLQGRETEHALLAQLDAIFEGTLSPQEFYRNLTTNS